MINEGVNRCNKYPIPNEIPYIPSKYLQTNNKCLANSSKLQQLTQVLESPTPFVAKQC
jgi:hypothetical protein